MYRSLYNFYLKQSQRFQYVVSSNRIIYGNTSVYFSSVLEWNYLSRLIRQDPRFALQTINNPIEDPLLVVDPNISQIQSNTSIELEIRVEVELESLGPYYTKKTGAGSGDPSAAPPSRQHPDAKDSV
jgi:hypothetical protein